MMTVILLGWNATQSVAYAGGWVRVINESDRNIEHLYISFSRDDNWEEDVLGDSVLLSGYNKTFTIKRGGCHVDLKAVMEDGNSTERHNLNVCGGVDWTVYDN